MEIVIIQSSLFIGLNFSAWSAIILSSRRLGGRPAQLAAADDVQVQVVNALTSVLAVVDDDPESFSESLLFGHLLGHNHQVSKQLYKSNPTKKNEINKGATSNFPILTDLQCSPPI